jgi:delta24(24(1))-sterol reductase
MIMIIHRARRDIEKCRRKYGGAWTQYEKAVPYLFVPVSYLILLAFVLQKQS